jgi:CheY-like chemotaxis protein
VATGTGSEALECLARWHFDVVLTDLGLPDIPGELVVRRATRAVPRPRVIVVTGHGEPFVSGARAAGADVVLVKPIDWVPLLHALSGQESERAVVNL